MYQLSCGRPCGSAMVLPGASHMAPTTGSTKAAKTKTPRGSTPRVGLRRVSLVVPDTRSKAFARQAHRESVTVRNSPHADEDQAFVDAISTWDS